MVDVFVMLAYTNLSTLSIRAIAALQGISEDYTTLKLKTASKAYAVNKT
jgi:hypothetical protein